MLNINGKKFRGVSNTPNGEVSGDTIFVYSQDGDNISAKYCGGNIKIGHLLGKIEESGKLNFNYHHISVNNELHAGKCHSTPEVLSDGRIRFYEEWKWYSDDQSEGNSIIEEI
ncbi:MAG: hypothetical protein SCALA702_03520 [Melioribacteraceae bacterium]|nr:MAG: hypothetical protein SCALA702_03520 [Melioribacteraceae bacterium]